jgi:hypothetical protein
VSLVFDIELEPISSSLLFRSGSIMPFLKMIRYEGPIRPVSGLPHTLRTLYRQCRERDIWSVSGGIQDEVKTVDHPKLLTVTIFSIIITQLLELQLPLFLGRLTLIGLKAKPISSSILFRSGSSLPLLKIRR